MLPHELFSPCFKRLLITPIEHIFKCRTHTHLLHKFLMPRGELVSLDDVICIKSRCRGTFDDGLGVEHHNMVELELFLGTRHDLQALQKLGKYAFVSKTLFQRRWDAEPAVLVDGGELSAVIDDEAAGVVLRFQ